MTEQDKINQAITATKRVMRALQRQCLPDLVTAWQELCPLAGFTPKPLTGSFMVNWSFMAECVWAAMEWNGDPNDTWDSWDVADKMLRFFVQDHIKFALECGNDDLAAIYRAFVEGK